MASRWHPDESQQIQKRIIVDGILTLKTPAHFGNGEQTGSELVLLQDSTGVPLLPGASLAGALRHYLLQREHGYRSGSMDGIAQMLFGEALETGHLVHIAELSLMMLTAKNAQMIHRGWSQD